MRSASLFTLGVLLLTACGDASLDPVGVPTDSIAPELTEASEREVFHQVQIELSTPMESGELQMYVLLNGVLDLVETRRFDYNEPQLHIGYNAPLSTQFSVVLLHVNAATALAPSAQEFVCFLHVTHDTSRHSGKANCDYSSTISYYMAATQVGQSHRTPFHDIQSRYAVWRALAANPDNDVTAFYVSIFATLQNALLGMGSEMFEPRRQSIRPIMETIIARFFDQYQRQGMIRAADLVSISNQVTDNTLPLERITRFQAVYNRYAHVSDVQLTSTGGSLTQRGRTIEVLTMSNELSRFFLRDSAFEMSDFRTHVVQDVAHHASAEGISVTWDPIAHMYGYNVYLNGQHIGFLRDTQIDLPPDASGTVTVKAVGYGGEFDGVHHELAGPTLIAEALNRAADE